MHLTPLDWAIIAAFFIVSLVIGLIVTRRAGSSPSEYFLSGRNMPWWLLGISMVATTFSADTPNLVTDIVRQNGISGNWVWWAFLLTGMLTVFVYAKLWRRSAVTTDLEFYELRYSGKMAAFLRGFRALYLGVLFNVLVMASVCLAAIKIGGVMLGLTPVETLVLASVVTVLYSVLGGLRGVIYTDFVQFGLAMIGAIGAAYVVVNLPEVGGVTALLEHTNVSDKLNLLPDFNDSEAVLTLLILPLAVQWWSVWYPGAEPGGGGYVAQRMLSAKDEKNAMGGTLLFNIAHYALRPWPWILVALCSLVVFPRDVEQEIDSAKEIWANEETQQMIDVVGETNIDELTEEQRNAHLIQIIYLKELKAASLGCSSILQEFPDISIDKIGNDLGYSAMLTKLPAGLVGLVLASLIAAFMSTISTHLNWGSSYVVNDFYKRFINPNASDRQQVNVGRWSTVFLMIVAGLFALLMSNALQAFGILLQIGAGTGLLFILRWFWWRINAWSEITAMVVSFVLAIWLKLVHPTLGLPEISGAFQLVIGVGVTTIAWVAVTFLTAPENPETLKSFYKLVKPGGPGWKAVIADDEELKTSEKGWDVPTGILCMVFGCLGVYSALFATGSWIYGNTGQAVVLSVMSLIGFVVVFKLMGLLKAKGKS